MLMTAVCLRHQSKRRCWAAVLVASLSFLLILTGAIWYFTTKLEPVQAGAPSPHHTAVATNDDSSQPPTASTSVFAPFLHIVPGQDGTDIFIGAGGVGELDATVFANVDIGPGHHKDSYTMAYSHTVGAYVATAIGFTPGINQEGTINITTTHHLDTGEVGFNRAHVPASTTQTVRSIDGNFELKLVSTDTIAFETYIAVVPSYAPPGPAPQGHRFVGSTYSVRAAAALTETNKPMLLRPHYKDAFLADADPHTLSIFAWDASNKRWDNLGGRLFCDQQYVSTPTRRFATYALMATPSWRDDFGDLSGLDFAETNNVTLGGTIDNRTLILASTPGNGTVVSQPIAPTTAIASWGTLAFTSIADSPTTTLTVDVLSVDGTELLTDVTYGASLAGIDPVQYPSLKLQANLSSTVAGETPALGAWQLTWEVEEHELFLPLVISSPVNADHPEQGQTPIPTPTVEAGELLATPGVDRVWRVKLGHRTITLHPLPGDDAQRQPFWREPPHKPLDTPAATQDKPLGLDTSGPNLNQLCASQCGALGWHRVMAETFEGTWPISPSPWLVRDFSDADGGEYLWGRRDCRPCQGDLSAWSIGGGADGSLLPCSSNYPNNTLTLATYGPFDLSQATDAQFQFSLWLDTESNFYDLFGYAASRNGENFEGYARSGDATYWSPVTLDLTDVPNLGDLTGEPQVWITFLFASDFSVNNYEGAFVDDVTIWAYEATPSPPPPTYTVPITLHTTLADFKRGRSDGGIAIQAATGGELALASQVTNISTWTRLPDLPLPLNSLSLVAAPYSLFLIGGNTFNSVKQSQVYCARIGPGGELGHWAATSPLPQALMSHAALLENGHLFVIGGTNNDGVHDSVFSARLQDDGTLGDWNPLPSLPQPRYRHAAAAANGYLFVLGGITSNEDVSDIIYRTPVNADGTLGDWTPLSRILPVPLEGHAAVVINDYLFIVGGWGGISPGMRDEVYKAAIDPEGNLGPWQSVTPLPQPLWWHAATVTGGGILVSGGLNLDHPSSALQRTVYRATPNANGDIDAWVELSPLPYPIAAHAFVVTNDYLYVAGGGQDIRPALGSVLMASLHTSPTAVHQGNFYHQFDLGSSALIKTLYWQETGDQGSIRVRYRLAPHDAGEYGNWSEYYVTSPIAVNSQGGYLAYQIKAESGDGSGRQVEAIGLIMDRTLASIYLPLIVRNASTR